MLTARLAATPYVDVILAFDPPAERDRLFSSGRISGRVCHKIQAVQKYMYWMNCSSDNLDENEWGLSIPDLAHEIAHWNDAD